MACTDMDVLSKECFRDTFQVSEDGNSKRGPGSPEFRHKQAREPLWMYGLQNLPLAQEKNRVNDGVPSVNRITDGEFWVPNAGCARELHTVHQKPQNSSALLGLIKGCGKHKHLLKGSHLHADILKHGLLQQDVCVGTALVCMYAKCGVLAKAQEVFDELPTRDVASWNALITGYTQHGLGNEALNCFKQMRDEGLSPDGVTFVCILKACGSIRATERGEEIHAEVRRQGLLKNNIMLGTALVDMYAKCGVLTKAQEVFDELPVRDVALWTALIAGYAQLGLGDEALNCSTRMRDEGLTPNAVTYVCLLKACGSIGATEKGEEIHSEVCKQGLLQRNIVLGTALVDMYAKCGMLAKAREVFEELPTRDVTLWNALIAGYAQNKLGDKAINCLHCMRAEGLSPNAVTFICILKACTSIEKGEEIHAEVSRWGLLEKNIVLGTALVDMYARCGMLVKAQEVFDKLSTRDVALWNALMAGYAQLGLGDEALNCFGQMQDEGLFPNAITFSCILKACGSIGATEKGEEIHREVKRQGLLEENSMLGNAVVDMYAKCGALAKAQEVFDELPVRDGASWNTLIAGYVQHELNNEALNCFGRMHAEGFFPDAVTFVSILKACGSLGKVGMGEEIHAEVDRQGLLEKHIVLGTALVDMYAKCHALAKAQQVFDELPGRDVASWTALMVGYAQHGQSDEALNVFGRMKNEGLFPNSITYICILKACGSIGAIEKGEEIHAEVRRQGLLENSVLLGNALVDMYAKCGMFIKAQEVFDELPARDTASWNAIISGYAQHGLADEALNCFGKMQDENLSPDAVTFVCILKACGSVGAVEKGEEIHAEVDRQGLLEKHIGLGTALVDMYAKCGALAKAQEAFDELPVRDVVCWTVLMAGYAQQGFGDEALNCFEQMREEGLLPDAATFVCLLKACSSIGAIEKGKEIHAEVDVQGLAVEKHMVLGNALVDMYAKCGELAKAEEVFYKLPGWDVVSWTALIAGYAQLGQVKTVFNLFSNMVREGIEPNVITFIMLLTACSHAGLLEEGQMYFDTMSNVYCIAPTFEHHACMVDLFSRAGHFDKAISVIEKVPPSDCFLLLSSLLGACRNWGNLEVGRWAFELAVQFDGKYAAAYVGMSNIYAATGMQAEVHKGKALRMRNEVWKIPGRCWWTDESGNVRSLLVEECYPPCLQQRVSQSTLEKGKEDWLCGHSEKLAIACALTNSLKGTPIRVTKNMRVCGDCHSATSLLSKMEKRKIQVKDANLIHIFEDGICVCEEN